MSRPRRRFGEKKVDEGPLPSALVDDNVFNQASQETISPPDAPLEINTPPHQSVTFPPLQHHVIESPPGHPVSPAQAGDDCGDSDTCLVVDPVTTLHINTTPDSKRHSHPTGSSSFRKRQFGSGRRSQDNQMEDEPDALSILDKVAQMETSMSCSDVDSPTNTTPAKQQPLKSRNNAKINVDEDGDIEEPPVQILRKGGSPGSLKSLRRGPTQTNDVTDPSHQHHQHQYSPQKPASPVAKHPDTSSVDVPSEIRCPVCLDGFNEPVTLLCNHNVCRDHILDLACHEESFTKPTEEFEVKCPKCRVTTHFPLGIASVKVNHEMNALVSMMMNLLAAQQQQQQVVPVPLPPAASSSPQPPLALRPGFGAQAGSLPAPTRSRSGGGRKAVTFSHEETRVVMLGGSKDGLVFDSDGALLSEGRPVNISSLPALESALKRAGNIPEDFQQDTSSAMNREDTTAQKLPVEDKKFQKAQKQLEGLEKQLEMQRERLKAEREEAARQKVLDYKRTRQEEIDKRREELLRELQKDDDDQANGSSPRPLSRGERSPALDDRVWGAAESALQKLKEERQRKREAEREAREKAIRDGVLEWANRGSQPLVSMDGSVLEKHLRAMADFESGGVQLNMSQKAREAEERIMHMYKTPTASEKLRRDKPPTPEPAPMRDIEVEHALWQAEQRVLREEEAELTRAQMAEIAEQRARILISNFAIRSGTAPKTPLKPSYVPKLNRLQKL